MYWRKPMHFYLIFLKGRCNLQTWLVLFMWGGSLEKKNMFCLSPVCPKLCDTKLPFKYLHDQSFTPLIIDAIIYIFFVAQQKKDSQHLFYSYCSTKKSCFVLINILGLSFFLNIFRTIKTWTFHKCTKLMTDDSDEHYGTPLAVIEAKSLLHMVHIWQADMHTR